MFSDTFYPTPEGLARKMIELANPDHDSYILEPSAGKGDILDAINKHFDPWGNRLPHDHVYAIEIVPDLRAILEGKGYPVIADNFLTYQPRVHFTHIIMNPPFNQAEQHLLHAWEILYDGVIVCLLPASSLEGKTSFERTIKLLIADHGDVQDVGQPFRLAERPTDEPCVLVSLKKCASGGDKLEWEIRNDREERRWNDNRQSQEVALEGFSNMLLSNYTAALNAFDSYNDSRQKLTVYTEPFNHGEHEPLKLSDNEKTPQARYNTFYRELTEQAWGRVFDHPVFQKMMTERARAMMTEFRQRQRRMDFNPENLKAMLEAVVAKREDILLGAVLDAFDTMTAYHEENRIYFEGWKSNKAWMVNTKKVVLPYYMSRSWDGKTMEPDYRNANKLNDIDRALCVVSGRAYDDIVKIMDVLHRAQITRNYGGYTESSFFEIRYFKKGTLHLRFKDQELGKQFNLMAARGRNWLPPGE
jgi:hypothetical protein